MTYQKKFCRIRTLAMRRYTPCKMMSGASEVSWEDGGVTHVEVGRMTSWLATEARSQGLRHVSNLSGGWWIIPAQGAGLLRHVLAVLYDGTSSWKDHAQFVAYLSLVILLPTEYSRVFVTRDMRSSVAHARTLFPADHPVWGYLFFDNEESPTTKAASSD